MLFEVAVLVELRVVVGDDGCCGELLSAMKGCGETFCRGQHF